MKRFILVVLSTVLLLAIGIHSMVKHRRQTDPREQATGEFTSDMDGLRRLFYDGMSEQELIQILSRDVKSITSDKLNADDWLAVANGSESDVATLKNDPVFWLLIGNLRLRENAAGEARNAAINARSLSHDDPAIAHWSWRLQRQAGFPPPQTEEDRILGVAFEHWVPGEPKGWAMVCTYGDAARLYLSWGAGMVGNVSHAGVKSKAERLLKEAQGVLGHTTIVDTEPALPREDQMAISILTPSGIRVAAESEEQIMDGKGPFAPLGLAAAELEAELLEVMRALKAR